MAGYPSHRHARTLVSISKLTGKERAEAYQVLQTKILIDILSFVEGLN